MRDSLPPDAHRGSSARPRRRKAFAVTLLIAFGACAAPAFAGPDSVVVFNEIHYNPAGSSEENEFIELHNQMAIKVDVSGWRLEGGIDFTFPEGTILDPGAYIVIARDPQETSNAFPQPFTGALANDGERLKLINHSDRLMDEVEFDDFDPWPIAPDGSGVTLAKRSPNLGSRPAENWTASAQVHGTPGTENFPGASGGPPPTITTNLLALDAPWRFNESGADLGSTWAQSNHAVGGDWESGPGVIAFESGLEFPIGTTLSFPGFNNPFVITYYFETDFTLNAGQVASAYSLQLRHLIDDGAVFYVNGTEVLRHNMPGGPVTAATLASDGIEATLSDSITLPTGILQAGTNRISVEVHQSAANSSDVVFGLELDIENEVGSVGDAPPLRFNEIVAADSAEFWCELVNDSAAPIDAGGIVVAASGAATREYTLPAGVIGAGEYLVLNESTLGFRPLEGDRLFIYSADRNQVADARRVTGRLRGRAAERIGAWLYPDQPTPGQPNTFQFNEDIVISEIMYNPPARPATPSSPGTYDTIQLIGLADVWRYNEAGTDLGANWAAAPHPEGGDWKSGPGLIAWETGTLPDTIRTPLTFPSQNDPFVVTYYFEREFVLTPAQVVDLDSLAIEHVIDDGAIFYVNGTEVGRFNMPAGAVNASTLASGGVGDGALEGPIEVGKNLIIPGTNRISVEVHQGAINSSDVTFGLRLQARTQLTPPQPGLPYRNSDNQWIELTNRGDAPVDLTGWEFGDGIDFAFPPGTMLQPGAQVVLVRDSAEFTAAFPGVPILGEFGGSLSRSGERLELRDAWGNTADEVRYYDGGRWPEFADGGGSSLELRDLDADNALPGAWAASDESSRTGWKTYSYRGTAQASRSGPDSQWRELVVGLLGSGEVWIDDFSVVENPDSAATQMLSNADFESGDTGWRLIGNHRHSEVIDDPDNPGNRILRLVATGPTEHMHNHVETTFAGGRSVANGREYEISFRARWVTGTNQLNTRLYFNRLPRTTIVDRPPDGGTPGAPNSRAEANIGPAFAALSHDPPVPAAGQPVTIRAKAIDSDGIASARIRYSVNSGAWSSTPMTILPGGALQGTLPGQSASTVVQFYIEAEDTAGAVSQFPREGPDSGTLYKVDDGLAATNGLHNFRIIVTPEHGDWLHTDINVMSNDRIPATVIYDEREIYYDVALRLKGSERARSQQPRVGFNIGFNPEQLFRGAHDTIAIDRSEGVGSGQLEILFDIMISNAGGVISRYYDLVKVITPKTQHTRAAVLQLARYDDVFLDSQFENGSDGTVFEYDFIYYPTTADANGYKRPQPDGVVGMSVRDQGDDKEAYRWNFLIKNNRERDDYDPLLAFCKLFSKSGAAFDESVDEVVDVDGWLRGMAYAVLSGAGDNYGANDGHNGMFYARPDDRVIFLPHDMDFAFDAGRSIFANGELSRLTADPARRRIYLGHLHDIITTTYNRDYMQTWTQQIGTLLPDQNFAGHLNYINSRSNNVLSQINGRIAPIDFAITTGGGNATTTSNSPVVLEGTGWVNVRDIRIAGAAAPLNATWTGQNTWRVDVPVPPGQSQVVLEAVDFSGQVIASKSISVTNTGSIEPASSENLVISKLMFDPAPPTTTESAAGFADSDDFEFLEVMNIGSRTIDLSGVRFTNGIDFAFADGATLDAGARVVVVRRLDAFQFRYAASLPLPIAAGEYGNGTSGKLDNGGETITLVDVLGSPIKTFRYDDDPPWPSASGNGSSFVLASPATNPDHANPANWRGSLATGGSPGEGDGLALDGWLAATGATSAEADDDKDGLNATAEYALGGNPLQPDPGQSLTIVRSDAASITVLVPRRLGADDVAITLQRSSDLAGWSPATDAVLVARHIQDGSGIEVLEFVVPAGQGTQFLRLEIAR